MHFGAGLAGWVFLALGRPLACLPRRRTCSPAAARMLTTAANSPDCHKSSVCHQAASSGKSGSAPLGGPGRTVAARRAR